ncbi:MAG: hypothetical protein ACOYKA_02955 [Legionellaceae bacterium]
MNQIIKTILAVSISLSTSVLFAAPKVLITHNTTDFESNGFVSGTIPSQTPTKAHTDGKVFWATVKLACFGHIVNNKCPALIKMKTDTAEPVELGYVEMDVTTGIITPSELHANGFTMIVNGPGETTLIKD